jgi:hypothetical protein
MPDCTCKGIWEGGDERERPLCRLHERGKARRKSDGAIVDVLRSAGFPRGARERGTWSSDIRHPSGVRPV